MPGDVTVTVKGLVELENALRVQAPKLAQAAFRRAGRRAAEIWVEAIAANAPELTGFLSKNIAITTRGKTEGLFVAVGPASKAGYFRGGHRHDAKLTFEGSAHLVEIYARYAEFGTRHEPARPFMRPAFDAHQDDVIAVFVDELWNALRDMESA